MGRISQRSKQEVAFKLSAGPGMVTEEAQSAQRAWRLLGLIAVLNRLAITVDMQQKKPGGDGGADDGRGSVKDVSLKNLPQVTRRVSLTLCNIVL